jgi:tetratricopeptide (TPR) repeat protein
MMTLFSIFDFRLLISDLKLQIGDRRSKMVCALCLFMVLAQPMLGAEGSVKPSESLSNFDGLIPGLTSGLNDSTQNRAYAALCKAVYWERMGHYQEFKGQMESAIQFDPHSSFLHAKLAEALFALKDFRGAVEECEMSLALNSDNADAHYLLGVLNFMRRDRQGAVSEFKTAAELKPEHFLAQFRLASLLFEEGDYSGAAGAYSEMVKLRPYDYKLRYQLGLSYSRSGKIAEAIKEFNAAAKLRSDYLEPHFRLAYLYAHQSKNREAIEECLIVLQAAPEDPNINLLLAELYVSIAEFDKAIFRAKKLLERPGIDEAVLAEAHHRLAAAYKGKGETSLADLHFQKSIDVYEGILKKDPENVGIYYDVAMVYDAKGDQFSLQLAEQHLRKHIELMPDEPNAYNLLGYMFVQRDMNLEEAVALIEKAVAIDPQNGAFRDSLGWAYFRLGKLDEAIAELEKAAEFIPDDSEVREHLGEAYLKRGRSDPPSRWYIEKAVLEWEKALEIKPTNASLQQRLGELRASLDQIEDSEERTRQQGEEAKER